MRYVLTLGKFGFFVEKITQFLMHDKLPLVVGKLSRQPVVQQAFLMSNFASLLAAAFCQMNVQAAWGDYCRAAAALKCWKKCWWRTTKVADDKRQTHTARDTDLGETVVKQYVLCGLKTVEPQDKNYTIFVA